MSKTSDKLIQELSRIADVLEGQVGVKAVGPVFADAEDYLKETLGELKLFDHPVDYISCLQSTLAFVRSKAHTTTYEVSLRYTPDSFEHCVRENLQKTEMSTHHERTGETLTDDETREAAATIVSALRKAGLWRQ